VGAEKSRRGADWIDVSQEIITSPVRASDLARRKQWFMSTRELRAEEGSTKPSTTTHRRL